jgi:hypothetical protein
MMAINRKCAMIFQQPQLISGSIQLSVADILFILACIESTDGQRHQTPAQHTLYQRLVGEYVGLVLEKETRHETQQLAS